MPITRPFPLLTIRRIASLSGKPVSVIQRLLDEHPDIQPTATADYQPVYDREALLRLLALVDQDDARRDTGGRANG